MENLGQRKALLSEKLKQRQEQEMGEVEKLTQAVLDELKKDLKKRVTAELNTIVGDIRDEIKGLPKQISDSTNPLKAVLEQAQKEANTLKLVSSVWFKALLLGVCTSVGFGLGIWGVFSWMSGEVQRLNSEISSAKATFAQLPKGMSYTKGENGKSYIIASKIGEPFEAGGKMAVEVN